MPTSPVSNTRLSRHLLAALLAHVLFIAAPVSVVAAQDVIGEATLVIGNAKLSSADGTSRAVEKGAQVRVGDLIETQAGGHVHVRFVDGARVSVRPSSRLVIENYADPQQSSRPVAGIRFRLDEGGVRSITGGWGAADKERFRLNTPVAAIGVKGTDFVVRSEESRTLASVFVGTIVLSPLTQACAETLGPCVNGREKVLSEAMKGQMLELRRSEPTPQLVPEIDLLAAAKNLRRSTAAAAPVEPQAGAAGASAGGASTSGAAAQSGPSNIANVLGGGASGSVQPLMSEAKVAEVLSQVAVPAPEARELTWGRYAWAPALAGDDYAVNFEAALLAGRQKLTIDSTFVLLRDQPAGSVFAPADSSAKFRLAGAGATVMRTDRTPNETVQVSGGTLEVDFARASFATRLQMQAARSGDQTIEAGGAIASNGTFRVPSAANLVEGGFNNSGTAAAYLFRKVVPNGVLMGTTLWGR